MKNETLGRFLGIAAVVVSIAGARAQVTIISDNLDSYSGNTAGYTFGDVTNASHTYAAGAGVGGSVGAKILSDFTPPGVGYGGVAYQYQDGSAVGNTSANRSDYTLSFDALVNKANGGFALIVEAWAGPGFTGAHSQSGSAADISVATPNVFQHFNINLGTLNPGLVPTGQTLQLAWQMDEYMYGGAGTGDELVIDNVKLTMVPEPSALALCLAGGAGVFAFLRRRRA
jgi:hypothetical protein